MQKLRNNLPKILFCLLLVFLLAMVRAFEDMLFYDPFAEYFENEYLTQPFPAFEIRPLIGSLTLRYMLNTLISLAIIYILFRDKGLVRFSALLYIIFFTTLMLAFLAVVLLLDQDQNFALFYIRRFLIQPIFLLLFVPAFYYQMRIVKKSA